MSNVHLFRYRWPRIQEGLEHTEVPFQFDLNKSFKWGTYAYYQGQWHHCTTRRPFGSMKDLVTMKVDDHQVPKEIRTLCLILT